MYVVAVTTFPVVVSDANRPPQVQAPAMQIPTPEQFFANDGKDRTKPNIAFLKNHFYREGRLSEEQALWILEKGTDMLRREPNVLNVDAPITGTLVAVAHDDADPSPRSVR